MHASTIENHEALTHVATDLVSAWRGTPPMTSEAQVREALTVAAEGTMANAESVDALLPYVVDACRKEGLLVDAPSRGGAEPIVDVVALPYRSSDYADMDQSNLLPAVFLGRERKGRAQKGKCARENFDSFTAWESAVSGSFGGIVRQWPEWAQAVYKAEHGYLP